MDSFVSAFEAAADADLMLCAGSGVAYQADMTQRTSYDRAYLTKIYGYDPAIAKAVNCGRCALVARHLLSGATLLDIGAGSGQFVREARSWGFDARGFDVIPEAARGLVADGLYDDDPGLCDAVTMWDSIEHMEEPALWLRRVRSGALLCVSVPLFADLRAIRDSKHYRPGEHLYYWTADGFVAWMKLYGFRLLESSPHEMQAGRDSIGAFAFCRDLK